MSRTRWQRWSVVTLAFSMVLSGCFFGGGDDDDDDATSATLPTGGIDGEPIVEVAGAAVAGPAVTPLGLSLSEGGAVDAPADAIAVVDGTALTADEVDALIARLPDWNVPTDDTSDFERPAETLVPPEADTIDTDFPPETTATPGGAPDDGPLEVVRFQPQGPVDVVPFFTVTFNQPMVPLATLDQLAAEDVPVVVTPAVDGRWRWIGTRTLRFEVEPGRTDRLPAATTYEVEVPAGTRSANGATLGRAVTWSFRTPAPSVVEFVNDDDSLALSPVFVAVFDQLVDPAAVLAATSVAADGDDRPIRLATVDEVEGDPAARRAVERALDDRWVAFTPSTPLPTDADIDISIGPDVPSAEGPLTSGVVERFTGHTFGAFESVDADCNSGGVCRPGDAFTIEFNNPIDPESFDADLISLDPAVAGLRIDVRDRFITLRGASSGQTTYSVGVGGALSDTFGQALGRDLRFSWRVGSAQPELIGFARDRFTIDPAADSATVSVQTINHDSIDVTAWAVTPNDADAYQDYLERQWSDAEAEPPEWPLLISETIEIDTSDDVWTESTIDLSAAFGQAGSQLVVRVEPTLELDPDDDLFWRNRPTTAWVQRTTLAVDAVVDDRDLLIWTTDLLTGEPVDGVPVELLGDGRTATTDDEGIARVELGAQGVVGLWATDGDRTAYLRAADRDGWSATDADDSTNWYVFDDRGVYRPGETVRLTGWVRRLVTDDGDEGSGLTIPGADSTVAYEAWDPQGNELAQGSVAVNALGGFNLTIDVPEGANLGSAWIELTLDDPAGPAGRTTSHSVQIQEFRRPEFEVSAQVESALPQLAADPATVSVSADYFSGGPLPDAAVEWLVSTTDTTYRPPNWADYSFGVWTPWWYGSGAESAAAIDVAIDECFDCGPVTTEYEQYSGRTDGAGDHYLQIDFDHDDVELPHRVTAEATVTDVNRQAWAASTGLVVHPAAYYVGVRSDRPFVERGTPLRIDAVVTDIDGAAVAGRPVALSVGRLDWTYDAGRWTEVVVDERTCDFVSTADPTDGSMRCAFETEVGGQYRVTAVVTDESGDRNRSEMSVWVSGGRGRPDRQIAQESATIVPDQQSYRPGDTAELLVQAPWDTAHGLLTVTYRGIELVEGFSVENGSAVVEVPIEEGWYPNVEVQVELVGAAARTADDGTDRPDLPARPAYATGTARLSIPPLDRELDVIATPVDSEVVPGGSTSVTVAVADAAGRPVSGAGVALVVVDEAVLSLTDHQLRDPLDAFYPTVVSRLRTQYSRADVVLDSTDLFDDGLDTAADAGAVEEAAADDGGDAAPGSRSSGEQTAAIDVRSDFDALALYEPDVATGADGTVVVDVPLPDSLTRYRVMAVAVDGAERFGTGESSITARLPLQVRPSAPRFLNFGDRAELPIVLQNQSDTALAVDVAVQTSNLTVTGDTGVRVDVPAGERVEVRFPVSTVETGTARARVVAASGSFSDASTFSIPVYTPATAEAFATYGTVDEGAIAQPVISPTDVFSQFGGLEISTSSTAVQSLTDAVLYLVDYPYDSADGYASRIMAVAALRDVLEAFGAEGLPAPAEIENQVDADLRALAALQNDDGGFPYWQRGRESQPWVTIQATHAFVLAGDAGYRLPTGTLDRALDHLAAIEQFIPFDTPRRSRDAIVAYSLHVRDLAGRTDSAAARALYAERGDDLELDALAWIWPSIGDVGIDAEIAERVANSVVETANAATFATGYTEDDYLIAHSDRRTDAVVLDAVIGQTPDSDVIPKVVEGLLAGRERGHWRNAQENAFVLLALDRYFEAFESVTPDFVARAWLGDLYVAESEFRGRTTEQFDTVVPMDVLLDPPAPAADDTGSDDTGSDDTEPVPEIADDGRRTIILSKEGDGRLYYRLGLRYAPDDLVLAARDEGFVVERTYEAIEDAADVTRDDDGTWRIAAGANVRVRLTMVADARRTHVALIDPLAAGLEAVNSALGASPTIVDDDATRPGWWWSWFEHQNLRDDRAEAFTTYLPGGTFEYTYIARATTPGRFIVPPARAEEIYSPEVFGRTDTDIVVVG